MINHEEYVLLIIKPDGVKKDCTDDVIQFFKDKGLSEVFRKRKQLTKQFIKTSFSAKCMKEELEEYLSSGLSDAVLLKGPDAYECVRLGKVEYRKKNNVDGEIENMIHSPEAGNEYERQLYFFFSNINGLKYCMYSDIYSKPAYCDEESSFIDALLNYDAKTNSKTVYVFQKDEFGRYRFFYQKYIERSQRLNWMFGIEYLCETDGKQLSLVGYYQTEDIEKTRVLDINGKNQVTDTVREIKENGGTVYLGFSRDLLGVSEETIQEFKRIGISGIILYHPSYTVEETAYIRENFLPKQFLIGGGSGGIAEVGRYSVSYEMLQSLYNLVYSQEKGEAV